MTGKRTAAEEIAHEKQMVRQAGEALVTTGHLILTAVALDNFVLLDWAQMHAYVTEQMGWATDLMVEDEQP